MEEQVPGSALGGSLEALVREASIEVIPLQGSEAKVAEIIPTATTVTITCSPKLGLQRSLEHIGHARQSGHRVIPHLAARQIKDEAELRNFIAALGTLGVSDLYVIGGDAHEPAGIYREASQILETLAGMDHSLTRIGVGCYPEGHPKISDDVLVDSLLRKQEFADYMVSQLCFDATTFVDWLVRMRGLGVTLPLRMGLAAPLATRKLIELSMKIGVGSSIKFLTKQHGLVGNLLLGRTYQPENLLAAMDAVVPVEELGIEGVHLFSFNQMEAAVDWQCRVGG